MERTTSSPQAYRYGLSILRLNRFIIGTDLGGKELRWRVTAGIVGRNVDKAVDVVLGNGIGNALNTVHMDIGVGEVPFSNQ